MVGRDALLADGVKGTLSFQVTKPFSPTTTGKAASKERTGEGGSRASR